MVIPVWASALVVGLGIIAVGAIVARSGLAMLSLKTMIPERTAASLKKDAHLVQEHADVSH